MEGGECLGEGVALEVAAGDAEAEAAQTGLKRGHGGGDGLVDAGGIGRVGALHGVVAERQVATLRASGPRWSREATKGKVPCRVRRPKVGLRPQMPQSEAGTRMEPLVSEPRAIGTRPPATAEPEPPEEPPDMRVGVVRVAGWAVMHVLAGEVVGVFAHVERADQDGTGGFEAGDEGAILGSGRAVAVDE